MVLPFVIPLIAGGSAFFVGKKLEGRTTEKKLELLKKLADLTPEQSAAVDAVSKQSVSELEQRVILGVGPFKPLPEQAAQRAKDIHAQKLEDKLAKLPADKRNGIIIEATTIHQEEAEQIATSMDAAQAQAITHEIVAKKTDNADLHASQEVFRQEHFAPVESSPMGPVAQPLEY